MATRAPSASKGELTVAIVDESLLDLANADSGKQDTCTATGPLSRIASRLGPLPLPTAYGEKDFET